MTCYLNVVVWEVEMHTCLYHRGKGEQKGNVSIYNVCVDRGWNDTTECDWNCGFLFGFNDFTVTESKGLSTVGVNNLGFTRIW